MPELLVAFLAVVGALVVFVALPLYGLLRLVEAIRGKD